MGTELSANDGMAAEEVKNKPADGSAGKAAEDSPALDFTKLMTGDNIAWPACSYREGDPKDGSGLFINSADGMQFPDLKLDHNSDRTKNVDDMSQEELGQVIGMARTLLDMASECQELKGTPENIYSNHVDGVEGGIGAKEILGDLSDKAKQIGQLRLKLKDQVLDVFIPPIDGSRGTNILGAYAGGANQIGIVARNAEGKSTYVSLDGVIAHLNQKYYDKFGTE